MRAMFIAILGAFLGLAAAAGETEMPTLDELKWVARPIVVFADSPNDLRLSQQLAAFEAEMAELEDRDVVILVDTDPATKSELRVTLRPRDFSVVVIGKDGQVKYRKPNPVSVKEVIRLIDRMPLRRQELDAERGQKGE